MVWHVVKVVVPYLYKDFIEAKNILTEALQGKTDADKM